MDILSPHSGVASAYILWLSVERSPVVGRVRVIKDGRRYLWFGGFAGLATLPTGCVSALVHRKLPDTYIEDAWREAASVEGVRHFGNWYHALIQHLPEEQKQALFGTRGLTKSAAARFAGITRQGLHAALKRVP